MNAARVHFEPEKVCEYFLGILQRPHPSATQRNVTANEDPVRQYVAEEARKIPGVEVVFYRPGAVKPGERVIVLRRPGTTWFGTLISSDGIHPTGSGAGFSTTSDPYTPGGDPTTYRTGDAASNVGYLLRTWLTVQKLKEVKQYVIDGATP